MNAAAPIADWKQAQDTARAANLPSLMVARGSAVTLTPLADLADWAWLADTLRGVGPARGYTVADEAGRELGVILQRGRACHAEWLDAPSGDYLPAGQGRTLLHAVGRLLDGHAAAARAAGEPAPARDDAPVLERLAAEWAAGRAPAERERVPYGARVLYSGSLVAHRGEVFTVEPHDHAFDVCDVAVDDCGCDPCSRYTLVGSGRVLAHVRDGSFTRAA